MGGDAFTDVKVITQGPVIKQVAQGSHSPIYMILEPFLVRVFLGPGCWRLASVSTWSGADQVRLIKHEQGHYDIHALLARDFYQRIRSIMSQPFDPALALEDVEDHRDATLGRVALMNRDYDATTWGSQKGAAQWTWWCAIERARQLHRSPPVRDPEGRLLKVELVDALRSFGLGYLDSVK